VSNRIKKKYMAGKTYFDYPTLFLVIFLICFGMVMIYSTSSYKSMMTYGNSYKWVLKQGLVVLGGAIAIFLISRADYRIIKGHKPAFLCLGIATFSMIAVLLVGAAKKGSVRWISIAGFQIQPSEFCKFLLIIYMANELAINASQHKLKTLGDHAKILVPTIPVIGLVTNQNLSTGLVICAMVGIMTFVVSQRTKELIITAVAFIAGIVVYLMTANSYRNERFQIWLHPETHKKGFQTMQALYAIGSGGIFGKGLGQSMQKMGFIPESHNDMIFSIICEELGLFGAVCLILVFAALIWRMLLIAMNADELLGSLLVIGVITHIAMQVFVNIAVVTNTIPPTGIPLPFISYGGSSIFSTMIEMGIVLSVSRRIHLG